MSAPALKSLASLAAERRLTLPEGLAVLRDAATALGALHEAGYAHGAVCAENLVLDAEGVARLCRDTLATPHPSPERRSGGPPDVQGDVYSLGATAAELLAGVGPLPRPVERLLATMTAETPADRYQSMDEVLTALDACELMAGCRASRPGQEPRVAQGGRRMLWGIVLGLGLLVVVLALVVVFGPTPERGKRPGSGSEGECKLLLDRVARPAP